MRPRRPLHWLLIFTAAIPIYLFICYTYTYGRVAVPIWDQTSLGLYIAIKTQQGTLALGDLFTPYLGHRHVFYVLYSVIWTWLADGNLETSIWIILVLVLAKYALLLALVRRYAPQRFYWLLLPLTSFVFAMSQTDSWIYLINMNWHLVAIWTMLGLLLLVNDLPARWAVPGAIICAILATITLAVGWAVWVALGIVGWLAGYRQWQYVALWLGSLAVVAALYFYHLSNHPADFAYLLIDPNLSKPQIDNPMLIIRAFLAYLGNVPVFLGYIDQMSVHQLVGGASILLMGANLLYGRLRRSMLPWLGLALFASGGGVLIALGRAHVTHTFILGSRFTAITLWWWVALFLLIAETLPELRMTYRRSVSGRALYYGNLMMVMLVLALYLPLNVLMARSVARISDQPVVFAPAIGSNVIQANACMERYFTHRDCFLNPLTEEKPEPMLQFAVYRLGEYADREAVSILPASADPNRDQVIINAPLRWFNLYVREFMLKGFSEDQILHLAPPDQHVSVDEFPEPLDQVWEAPTSELIDALTADQVWYVTLPERAEIDAELFALTERAGYTAEAVPITIAPYNTAEFTLYQLRR